MNEKSGGNEDKNSLMEWFQKNRQILYGFVGWYICNGLIYYVQRAGDQYLFGVGLFTFPANLLVLIVLALIKATKKIALGIVAALALNFLLDLAFGSIGNSFCFIPFYVR